MGFANNTDRDWQKWGEENPYFGVVTHPEFLSENLNDRSLAEFFSTGKRHVDHVFGVIRGNDSPAFTPARVLDYGCGVGRIVIPLAAHSPTVVGIDVSTAMLNEARKNCNKFDVPFARLLHVNEMDSLEPASFDFIHSFIVFQHIPVARGEAILRKLITLLAEGGVGAIQFTYSDTRSMFRRGFADVRRRIGVINGAVNLARHKPFSAPTMQMNIYSINRIFDILVDALCSVFFVEFTEHGSHRGAMVYFRKASGELLKN